MAKKREKAQNIAKKSTSANVGFEVIEEDDEVFEEKMKRLTKELAGQFGESNILEKRIKENLNKIGYKF